MKTITLNTHNNIYKAMYRTLFATLIMLTGYASTALAAGLLSPKNGEKSNIQMKSHHVNVTINNGFARTEVDQIFFNSGDTDLEAIYSFPVPKQGSLSEVSMWIDGKEVIGEVLEKERAKKVYQEQVAKGNDAALAEKNDYKTFEINVYPVRAGNETRIRLVYYQPLEIDLNIGRYVYQLEEGNVDEVKNSFWSVDEKVHGSFKFDALLKSNFPIRDIRIPAYEKDTRIQQVGSNASADNDSDDNDSKDAASADSSEDIDETGIEAGKAASRGKEVYKISLDIPEDKKTLSRDIVLYYRLDDNVPARVEVIPYKESSDNDGTFMMVVTPGASLTKIKHGVDWTFVLDISGSMEGNKIATLADGVGKVITKMSPQDRFRIITFNTRAEDFSSGYITATPGNVRKMVNKVKTIEAGGGTDLFAGLSKAYQGLDADRITGIMLVTDGVITVGESAHDKFLKLLRKYDIRLFTFVIGNSANQPLMDRLARDSGGFAMNVSTNDDIVGRIIQAKVKVMHECIYDVKVKFSGKKVKNVTPQKIGNLFAGQQLVSFGRYSDAGMITIDFKSKIAGKENTWTCEAFLPEVDRDNPELERLWALSSVDEVMEEIREKGETNALRGKIVRLGTEYSLATDYTSMLVIRDAEMDALDVGRNNADRVDKERKAQKAKATSAAKNYRVDNKTSADNAAINRQQSNNGSQARSVYTNNSTHQPSRSQNIGSGPVGPFFLGIAYWIRRRKLKAHSLKHK